MNTSIPIVRDTSGLPLLHTVRNIWTGWSLARQFATSASIVLLPAMAMIGLWVSSRIEEAVTQNAAISAALYMESFIEPMTQDLANGELSSAATTKLGNILKDTALGQRVATFKVWRQGGIIAASSRPELIGRQFTPSAGLQRAWTGQVSADFDHLPHDEHKAERDLGVPLLEVYVPLRARGTADIIAVGEFYERATVLKSQLAAARMMSWMIVAAVTLSMLTALFGIVRRGSATIETQRRSLERQIAELTTLLNENQRLRTRVQDASARASETTESYLRRLGADLHDGPAQLISLALLRLDEPSTRSASEVTPPLPTDGSIDQGKPVTTRTVLTDALREIRLLAEGLAVPEIETQSLRDALRSVILRHEQLTGTTVQFECPEPLDGISSSLRLSAYRFVQEGLSNAFRHAKGMGQSVKVARDGNFLLLIVSDSGPGFAVTAKATSSGIGLKGLFNRIESLGGVLQVASEPDRGTKLTARLPLAVGEFANA